MSDKKILDMNGVAYLYHKLSLEDYPNNEVLKTVINSIDQTKADKIIENGIEKKLATKEYVDNYFSNFNFKIYKKPTEIDLYESMQIIFYAAAAGTMEFQLGDLTFSKHLENSQDTGWYLWVWSGDTDGSFISPSGTRTYMNIGKKVETANVSFTPDDANTNHSYVIITTK